MVDLTPFYIQTPDQDCNTDDLGLILCSETGWEIIVSHLDLATSKNKSKY